MLDCLTLNKVPNGDVQNAPHFQNPGPVPCSDEMAMLDVTTSKSKLQLIRNSPVQSNKTAFLRQQPAMVGVTGYYAAVSA